MPAQQGRRQPDPSRAKGSGQLLRKIECAEPPWPSERSIPGTYSVGGRHVIEPTSPIRDSSRWIDKAPGIMTPTHRAAPRRDI